MNVNLEYCDPFDMADRGIWMKIEHCGRYLYACDRLAELGCKLVTDAACANGYGSLMLANAGFQVTGLDINSNYLAIARSRSIKMKADYFQIDFDKDPFPSNLVNQDAIVCFETIEHVSQPMVLLKKIYCSLKEEGTLLLSFPNAAYEKFDKNGNNKDPYHKHIFQKAEILSMLKDTGFRIRNKVLGQSICNIAYSFQSKFQKEGKINEDSINALFLYDSQSILNYSSFLGYPNEYQVDDTYSYIIEASK